MRSITLAAVAVAMLSLAACGGSSSDVVQPQYQPQITNLADSFSFQLTGVSNGDGALSYTWANSGQLATVDRSSAITSGTVTLTLRDGAGTQVYSGPLNGASGSVDTGTGVAGNWTIAVDFAGASGTINFRCQKK